MRIRMTQTLSALRETFKNGVEYDVDEVEGREMVNAQLAVAIDVDPPSSRPTTPAAVPVTVPAALPTPRKTRKAKADEAQPGTTRDDARVLRANVEPPTAQH